MAGKISNHESEAIDLSTRENLRNLALILGITILLVLVVILVVFFISGLNAKPSGSVTSTDGATTAAATTPSTGGTTTDTTTPSTPAATTEQVPAGTTAGAETGSTYTLTAGGGDSVTWLARRAMYAYMGDRGLGLDRGQRLYFETILTQQSNPVELEVGETRTFTANTMDQIFSAAANLAAGQLSAWTNLAVQSGYV